MEAHDCLKSSCLQLRLTLKWKRIEYFYGYKHEREKVLGIWFTEVIENVLPVHTSWNFLLQNAPKTLGIVGKHRLWKPDWQSCLHMWSSCGNPSSTHFGRKKNRGLPEFCHERKPQAPPTFLFLEMRQWDSISTKWTQQSTHCNRLLLQF